MQLHLIQGKQRKRKRIGRGGKRGTYSGRGVKGQKARAGHRIRPAIRDYIKQVPKLRGYAFGPTREKPRVLSLTEVEAHFGEGELVSPKTLAGKGLARSSGGKLPEIKILGAGKLAKRLVIRNCALSASARAAIEHVGGTVLKSKSKFQSSNDKSNPKSK